jgi:hypothetical protein
MATDVEEGLLPADSDQKMCAHILCPHCNPDWQGEIGAVGLCGEKLLGVPAGPDSRLCKKCRVLWFKHIATVHRTFWGRG